MSEKAENNFYIISFSYKNLNLEERENFVKKDIKKYWEIILRKLS